MSDVAPCYHPLNPLTAKEIEACSLACTCHAEHVGLGSLRFNTITLKVHLTHS